MQIDEMQQSAPSANKTAITFTSYGIPVDAKLPNGDPIGDHTWVTTQTKGKCWPCLGRGCKANSWDSGKYVPPAGSRQLSHGKQTMDAATCMGDPKKSTFMKVPMSADIVYGVNGVCHQIANRVLYYSGKTVAGADQFKTTSFFYGTHGTKIPFFVYAIPIIGKAALAMQGKVWWDWYQRKKRCKKLKMHAPDAGELIAGLEVLYDATPNDQPMSAEAQLTAHLDEIKLQMEDRLGAGATADKISAVQDVVRHYENSVDRPSDAHDLDGAPEIDPDAIVMAAKPYVQNIMGTLAETLGAQDFESFTGNKPGEYVSFLNPEMFRQ